MHDGAGPGTSQGGLHGTSFVYSEHLLPTQARAGGGETWPGIFHVSDWLPTIVGALTGAAPAAIPGFALDGVDHWPAIASGGVGERDVVLLELDLFAAGPVYDPRGLCGGDAHGDRTQTPYAALRQGDMKLLLGNPGGGYANACEAALSSFPSTESESRLLGELVMLRTQGTALARRARTTRARHRIPSATAAGPSSARRA